MKRYHFCGEEDNATESEDGGYVKYEDALAAIKAAVEAEREACRQIAVEKANRVNSTWIAATDIADLIDARSQK